MKITGTRNAFMSMLQERGVYKKLDVDRATVANWKRSLLGDGDRQPPTLDKMEEMLEKYGATVVKEKVWELPG